MESLAPPRNEALRISKPGKRMTPNAGSGAMHL